MALLDDLRGILSAAEFAKLEADATVKTRLERGDELRSFYDGDEPPVTTPPVRAAGDPPPARRDPPPPSPGLDLSAVERLLDARQARIDDAIKAGIDAAVKTRGDELYNNVRAGVRGDALQLVKIYTRHQNATGKEWDDAEEQKFNDYLKTNTEALKAGTGGKPYATLTDAYNDYIAPVVTERTIESEVTKRVKEKTSGQHLPGTTPGPAVNSTIRVIMSRGRTDANGQPTSSVDKAAAALDRRMANAQEATA